jgi:hypothetical protein
MKKSLLIMAMVGLMIWFPLLADAKGGKDEAKQVKVLQKEIKNLQKEIKNLEKQIDKIQLSPGDQGEPGPQGPAGADGQDGADGVDGYTPVKGVDYFDGEDGADGLPGPAWVDDDGNDLDTTLDDLYDRIQAIEIFLFPTDRFTDMGDGTIRDNETGLRWLRDANCSDLNFGLFGYFAGRNLEGALAEAAELSYGTCGLTDGSAAGDWRLPSKADWEAFHSPGHANPALVNTVGDAQWSEGDAFVGVQSGLYWSRSTTPGGTPSTGQFAWAADMESGNVDANYSGWDHHFKVWPVRSGN